MDRKSQEAQEIQRLTRLAQASRSCLGKEAADLRKRLDFPARIRGSLQAHPSAWLFGSLVSGLATSLMFRRRPAVPKKHRGISGALIGLTLTAARPLAKLWLSGQLKQWSSLAFQDNRQSTPGSNPANPQNPSHVHSQGPGPR